MKCNKSTGEHTHLKEVQDTVSHGRHCCDTKGKNTEGEGRGPRFMFVLISRNRNRLLSLAEDMVASSSKTMQLATKICQHT